MMAQWNSHRCRSAHLFLMFLCDLNAFIFTSLKGENPFYQLLNYKFRGGQKGQHSCRMKRTISMKRKQWFKQLRRECKNAKRYKNAKGIFKETELKEKTKASTKSFRHLTKVMDYQTQHHLKCSECQKSL